MCENPLPAKAARCRYCRRDIVRTADGRWIDPEATGDDIVWSETCDAHDTFTAEHVPERLFGKPDLFTVVAEGTASVDPAGEIALAFEKGINWDAVDAADLYVCAECDGLIYPPRDGEPHTRDDGEDVHERCCATCQAEQSGPCVVCAITTARRAPGTPIFACGYHGGVEESESDKRARLQRVYTEPRERN